MIIKLIILVLFLLLLFFFPANFVRLAISVGLHDLARNVIDVDQVFDTLVAAVDQRATVL